MRDYVKETSEPSSAATTCIGHMSHSYRYRRGDLVIITSGRYKGIRGIVESRVYQRTVDRPNDYDAGYHVVIGKAQVVTVRWDQVESGT